MLLQWSAISAVAIRIERKEIVGIKLAYDPRAEGESLSIFPYIKLRVLFDRV
jgi:hypothetical protein